MAFQLSIIVKMVKRKKRNIVCRKPRENKIYFVYHYLDSKDIYSIVVNHSSIRNARRNLLSLKHIFKKSYPLKKP